MEEKITLIIKAYGITHTCEFSEECTATEIVEKCAMLIESIGFSPVLVVEALGQAIESRL
jgi:hypothetical protein